MQLRLQASNSKSEENKPSMEALASVNTMYTHLRRLPVFRLLSLGVGISDYNEIMELPLLSPRKCTQSPEILELLHVSPRRNPHSQSIPNIMKKFFVEWDDLIAHTKNNGPFNQDGEEGENEEDEEEEQGTVEEKIRNTCWASPVAIDDDRVVAYLSSAAAKGTRSIPEGSNKQ